MTSDSRCYRNRETQGLSNRETNKMINNTHLRHIELNQRNQDRKRKLTKYGHGETRARKAHGGQNTHKTETESDIYMFISKKNKK